MKGLSLWPGWRSLVSVRVCGTLGLGSNPRPGPEVRRQNVGL
jgi:hypothetical protein